MKYAVGAFALLTSIFVGSPSATAAPPVDEDGHVHHVTTGSGECVPIDAVAFLAEARGLHQGATASGPDRGPRHGLCG